MGLWTDSTIFEATVVRISTIRSLAGPASGTPPVGCLAVTSPAHRPDTDDLATPEDGAPSVPGAALVDDSRRVLVHLLQGPFLDGRRDGARYAQLLRDRAAIEARLADLFL